MEGESVGEVGVFEDVEYRGEGLALDCVGLRADLDEGGANVEGCVVRGGDSFSSGDGGSGASNSSNLNSGTAGYTPPNTPGNNFLQVLTAHNPRILQLGAKFIF